MKNTEPQQVKFEDIYLPHWHQLRKYENYLSIHNGFCYYSSPEATTQEISQLFDKVGFYNKRKNPYNYITRNSDYYNYLMDTKLSNMIQPNSITLDAHDAIDIWENGKLKFCHMFIEQEKRQRGKVFPYKNNRGEYYNNQMCVDTTPRCLCNKIKINIVVDDGDYHLHCNQYGLPKHAYIDQEKINGIKVNQEHLLEIQNPTEFQFFAEPGEKYNGIEIHPERPITLQMQGEKMVVASFFDIDGKKIDCLTTKQQKQTTQNKQKEVALKTLQEIQTIRKKHKYAISFKPKSFDKIKQKIQKIQDIDKLLKINNLLTNNLIAHKNLQEINNIEETNKDRYKQHNKEQIIKTFNELFDVLKTEKTYTKIKTTNKTHNNEKQIDKNKERQNNYQNWFEKHCEKPTPLTKTTKPVDKNDTKTQDIGKKQTTKPNKIKTNNLYNNKNIGFYKWLAKKRLQKKKEQEKIQNTKTLNSKNNDIKK